MLRTLKQLFDETLSRAKQNAAGGATPVELAAAVLMVEISLADSELMEGERHAIEQALRRNFHLEADTAQRLTSLAETEVDHAVSLFEFTRVINDSMGAEEKARVVELLWSVAFADAILDKHEEYYIRKIADLLHVPHAQFIRAKHRAADGRQTH